MNKTFFTAFFAFVVLCLPPRAVGVITLSQEFDSGSLNVAASTASDDAVRLVGRGTWTAAGYANRWRLFGPWSRPPYYETAPHDVDSAFALLLAELEPSIVQSVSFGTPGMLRIWAQSDGGLSATHAFTPEFGCQPDMFEARLDEMGANYARALYLALVPEPATVSHLVLITICSVVLTNRIRRNSRQ